MAVSANRTELLQIADAVARDKSIDKSVVLHAMEEAMQRAAKAHYGSENEIKVEIDPKTGETHVSRYLNVVEQVKKLEHAPQFKQRVANGSLKIVGARYNLESGKVELVGSGE